MSEFQPKITRNLSVVVAALLTYSFAAQPAQAQTLESGNVPPIFNDWDEDGIPNSIDQRSITPDAPDVDGDGILNYADRSVYIADHSDADFDGTPNAQDRHPYVPFVVLNSQESPLHFSFGCNERIDNDCDGINNFADQNDFVAEYPDVDGDGIINKYDNEPYRNPYVGVSINGATAVSAPGSTHSLPIIENQYGSYQVIRMVRDLVNNDRDGDGLMDIVDPYPDTSDWDRDGRLDGNDLYISVDQDRVEDERQAELREAQRLERERLEDARYDDQLNDARLRQQREQERLAQQRLEQQRQQDRIDQQRRDDSWDNDPYDFYDN